MVLKQSTESHLIFDVVLIRATELFCSSSNILRQFRKQFYRVFVRGMFVTCVAGTALLYDVRLHAICEPRCLSGYKHVTKSINRPHTRSAVPYCSTILALIKHDETILSRVLALNSKMQHVRCSLSAESAHTELGCALSLKRLSDCCYFTVQCQYNECRCVCHDL